MQTTEIYEDPSDAEFIGLRNFKTDDGVYLTYRCPRRVFAKIGWSVNDKCAKSRIILASTLLGKSVALLMALGAHEVIREIAVMYA